MGAWYGALVGFNLNLAEVLSLLCIVASFTQQLPTISRVLRTRSTRSGSLPFWPHLIEASWRTWFCMYLWVVVRDRRPLGQAPEAGWLAGHDGLDLFLYGDTILSCCVVWLMLFLHVAFEHSTGRAALALTFALGLPLFAYTSSDGFSQPIFEQGMRGKDCVIILGRLAQIASRCDSGGGVTTSERFRHGMGGASAALRIVTTLTLPSFVGSATLLRGWVVILGSEAGLLALGFYPSPAKGNSFASRGDILRVDRSSPPAAEGGSVTTSTKGSRDRQGSGALPRSLSRSLSSGGALEKEL